MLVFTTKLCKKRIVVKDMEEVAELFASSFGRDSLSQNKKECFLEFDKENQIKWCESSFNASNLHLLKNANVLL